MDWASITLEPSLSLEHPPLARIEAYFALLSKRPAYRDHVIAARPQT